MEEWKELVGEIYTFASLISMLMCALTVGGEMC